MKKDKLCLVYSLTPEAVNTLDKDPNYIEYINKNCLTKIGYEFAKKYCKQTSYLRCQSFSGDMREFDNEEQLSDFNKTPGEKYFVVEKRYVYTIDPNNL